MVLELGEVLSSSLSPKWYKDWRAHKKRTEYLERWTALGSDSSWLCESPPYTIQRLESTSSL
jgi:hypothetical protein